MHDPITGSFRQQFAETFIELASANPHTTAKDREQASEILALVEAVVRGTISRGVPTYIEDDELIQECLTRVPDAIRGYQHKNGSSLKTYLKSAIRNDVLDVIARERREPIQGARSGDSIRVHVEVGPQGDDEYLPPESKEQEALDDAFDHAVYENSRLNSDDGEWGEWERGFAARKRMRGWMEWVTKDQAVVLALCIMHGMTQEAAADKLGITREAVKSRLSKGIANIRKQGKKVQQTGTNSEKRQA